MGTLYVRFLCLICVFFLVSCGPSKGVITGVTNDGERISLQYEGNTFLTLIDGELYSGKAVEEDRFQISGGVGQDLFNGGGLPPFNQTDSGISRFDLSTSTGRFRAVLIGNMGSSMTCDLQYSNMVSPSGGGVGSCRISDGRSVRVVW